MPRKACVLLLSYLFVTSVVQAQTGNAVPVPPPTVDQGVTPQSMDVGTPDQVGDSDPLDVLEPKKEATPIEPTVPQFTEIPDPNAKPATSSPSPEVKSEPAHEIAAPSEPAPAPEAPLKKNSKKKKKSATVVINNDPDVNRETHFHNIYKKYNEQPTSEEAWEKASGTRKGEVYKVQKGDTLWAVSNTFFADANYWPKIWSLNVGEIGNPHEIDSKMSIQFFPGTMADAPTLGLVEKSASEIADAPLVASNSDTVPVTKARKHAPVLQQIPQSIPNYVYGKVAPVQTTILDAASLERHFHIAPEYLSYYIANNSPENVGRVSETELGMNTATEFQYVIVRLDSLTEAHKTFVVFKELDKVKDPDGYFNSGHLIELQGSVEIIDKVHDSKNLYRAIVKKTIQPIDVGAKLMPGALPTFDPSPTALAAGVHAQIIGGEYESKRQQYQSNMIVFINAGSSQGVHEGQSFAIFSNIRNRNEDTAARVNDRRVGTVKVIRVSDSFATAYVTGAQDDIFVGDSVGARNQSSASNDMGLDNNTDINKSPKSDLVPPVKESNQPADTGTNNSDFELQ